MKYIITYCAFKRFPSKEVYTDKEIAEWRYENLRKCVNASDVKMKIEEGE